MKQGASDYLLKDRLSRLGEAVRHALHERQLRYEKRQAERNLHIMDWAIQSSINAMAIADLDGRITFVNEAFLDLWGYDDHEQVYRASLLLLWEDPDEAQVVKLHLKNRRNLMSEMAARRQDGSAMILQFSTSTVLDENRQPICIMAIFNDITEQKKAAEAQREAEILRIQLEKEKELRDLKSRFMSMVIHDFRNPLAVMQLQLDALLVYKDRLTEDKKEDRINLALSQIQHLNALMDDVLAISRLESSAARFQPDNYDLIPFCRETVDDFSKTIGSNHKLSYISQLDHKILPLDLNLMRRALTNLLSNAVKYSPEGSTVGCSINAHDGRVYILVSDEGIGIPEDDQKWLFDPFHRAGNVGAIEGTGLGLAIVKQVVELHKGHISFKSEVNKGTTFIIDIPCSG
jgi:PAS domain S-box-containing protein